MKLTEADLDDLSCGVVSDSLARRASMALKDNRCEYYTKLLFKYGGLTMTLAESVARGLVEGNIRLVKDDSDESA